MQWLAIIQATMNIPSTCIELPDFPPQIGEACVIFTQPCNPPTLVKELINLLNETNPGQPGFNLLVNGANGNPQIVLDEHGDFVVTQGTEGSGVIFSVQNDPSLSTSQGNTAALSVPAIVGIVVVAVVLLVAVIVGIIFFRKSSGDTPMEIV